jgi:hypothetical protein
VWLTGAQSAHSVGQVAESHSPLPATLWGWGGGEEGQGFPSHTFKLPSLSSLALSIISVLHPCQEAHMSCPGGCSLARHTALTGQCHCIRGCHVASYPGLTWNPTMAQVRHSPAPVVPPSWQAHTSSPTKQVGDISCLPGLFQLPTAEAAKELTLWDGPKASLSGHRLCRAHGGAHWLPRETECSVRTLKQGKAAYGPRLLPGCPAPPLLPGTPPTPATHHWM